MNDDSLRRFERLASRANAEPPWRLDVTARVMQSLQTQGEARSFEREYLLAGGGSLVAAGLAWAIFWMCTAQDALIPLAQPFVTVFP